MFFFRIGSMRKNEDMGEIDEAKAGFIVLNLA